MSNMFKNFTLAASVSLIALTGTAYAAEMDPASDISVDASYNAAEDTNAMEMFPGITQDVEVAIAKLIPMSDSPNDPVIRVDIRKLALDGDTILPDSTEFNQMEGVVAIDTVTGIGGKSFPINIVAVTDLTSVPDGYVGIAPSVDDFYNAMIDAFAADVAKNYGSINDEGLKGSN
ncbi:hypothetical protein Z946_4109 [Sulfitobacter noctilucicola]|uniref:Uncharacterized protein n=1 Tax=Sulfitobacter noctilucicola TaxID=1342301 RepID=A0A7W6M8L3_9RHOB|nr:hypothetical protein [Sulfitobacter noctilucicola]KIN65209.1 hypothetical protein Z946_4109 [Sulfitobacter noctilucicola]MBB4173657.1 hypothetical protein [Sulfitobacter noctilucicola]